MAWILLGVVTPPQFRSQVCEIVNMIIKLTFLDLLPQMRVHIITNSSLKRLHLKILYLDILVSEV